MPIPLFDNENSPRWTVRPPNIRTAQLDLQGPGFTGTLPLTIELRGESALVRSSPVNLMGRFSGRLIIDGRLQWQGTLRWIPNREAPVEIRNAAALWHQDRNAARAKLNVLTQQGEAWERFYAFWKWGRLEWADSATTTIERWSEGYRALESDNAPIEALGLGCMATFVSMEAGRQDVAAGLLKEMHELSESEGTPLIRADMLLFEARLAVDLEDAQRALELARQSASLTWPVGNDEMWAVARQLAADQLLALGRYAEARDVLGRAQDRFSRPRNRIMAELNLLWIELWGREAGVWTLSEGNLERRFEALLSKCQDPVNKAVPADLANVKSCLAYLALRRDDVKSAAHWLKDASTWKETELGWERWFIRLIIAETQLRSGRLAEAEAALQAIIAGVQKEAGNVSPHTVIAHRLRADIYETQGRKTQAVQALNEAWQSSFRVARRMSQIGAKNHFLHLHRALPMRYARAVLDSGDALGAAAVIDEHLYEGGSQIRALSARRTDPELWRPVKDARAALAMARRVNCKLEAPDERVVCRDRIKAAQQAVLGAELSFYAKLQTPRRANAKAALAQRRAQLTKGEGLLLSAGDGQDLQAFLLTKTAIVPAQGLEALSALAPHLEKLSALQVAGPLDPWAQLSPDARPWAARLPIYYSQYARTPAAAAAPSGFPGPTLLVADPSHNLAKTAKRIAHWQKRFGVTALKSRSATRAAVLKGLKQRPALFFFSGHSAHDDLDQTSTRIVLSKSHIDLQDVLADNLAARLVVLNGCSTGASEAGYGAGLPEAFMHQGTEAVLGTIRVLQDGEAEAFLDRFFDASATQSPVLAMRDAVRASIEAKDDSWKNLRLWR